MNIEKLFEEKYKTNEVSKISLWDKISADELNGIFNTMPQQDYNRGYRLIPYTSEENRLFQRHWFEIVDDYPKENIDIVRYWDLAATKKSEKNKNPSWTAGGKLGRTADGIWFIIDIRRIQDVPLEVERLVKNTAIEDGQDVTIYMEQEPGSSGVNTIDYYSRNVLVGYSFYGNKETGNKVTRALPFSSQAKAGNVKIVRGEWNNEFLNEVEVFPDGESLDQVDTMSGGMKFLLEGSPSFRWA